MIRRDLITLLVAMFAATAAMSAQQRQPPPLAKGTASLRGTITDTDSREPIANCSVSARSGSGSGKVITAANGAYEFSGIADGTYWMTVDCPSYVSTCFQPPESTATNPLCSDFSLFKDQRRIVDFKTSLGAIIRGRVVDSTGHPLPKASVRIGGPFFGPGLIGIIQSSTTGDDGAFELANLPAGSWRIEVEIPPATGAYRSTTIFYPGVLSRDDAGGVEVEKGATKDNVVISVPAVLDHTLTVRVPPPDATFESVDVSLIRAVPLMTRKLSLDRDGQAIVKGLIDGRYVVVATAVSGQKQRWVDFQAVDFLSDSIDVALQLQPAGKIRGRIVADRGGLPALAGATIGAEWVESDITLNPVSPDETAIAADGTFEIAGMFGRRKLQLGAFDPEWKIESVLQGRSDVSVTGIDVVPNTTAEVTVVVRRR